MLRHHTLNVSGNYEKCTYFMSFMKIPIRKLFLLLCIIVSNISAQSNQEYNFTELNKTLNKDFAKDFEFSVLIESNDLILFS